VICHSTLAVAEIDLDQPNAGNGHGPRPTAVRSCLPPPSEYHACCNSNTARDLTHLCARLQRLFDDPNLVVLRPASSPLNPAQNLDPHKTSTRIP
jgi:hypothetical protein